MVIIIIVVIITIYKRQIHSPKDYDWRVGPPNRIRETACSPPDQQVHPALHRCIGLVAVTFGLLPFLMGGPH